MGEEWRRKSYYKPRVLIDVGRVLDPQSGDSMLCITGAQLEMLRNLTQYLHRRTTYVAEYHDGYYLCADNEDFDAIEAIVAELEETLMGCEEITASLDSIASQLTCLCSAANRALTDGRTLGPIVDGYLTDGTLIPYDTYGGTTAEEDERCALAQLVYWQAWQVVVNLIGPLDELAIDLLMPVLVGFIATLAGGPVVGIPAALLIMLVRGLVEEKVGGTLGDVLSTWEDAEEDIICAVYVGLATGYREAERLAMEEIVSLPVISPVAMVALHCLVCPWAIMAAKEAYDNASDFAIENVTPGYCVDCDEVQGRTFYDVTWPPCEGSMFQETGFCAVNEWKCACNNVSPPCTHLEQIFTLGDPNLHASCSAMEFTIDWYSQLAGNDQPAGWFRLARWRVDPGDWVQWENVQFRTDSVDPMTTPTIFYKATTAGGAAVGDKIRIQILHTAVDYEYPTDIMLGRFQMDCTMVML